MDRQPMRSKIWVMKRGAQEADGPTANKIRISVSGFEDQPTVVVPKNNVDIDINESGNDYTEFGRSIAYQLSKLTEKDACDAMVSILQLVMKEPTYN